MKLIDNLQALIRELNTKAHADDADAFAEAKARGEEIVHQIKILVEGQLTYKKLLSLDICPACGGALKYMGMVYGPAGPQGRKVCEVCSTAFMVVR